MIYGNATLVIDLGNSSTKGALLYGKDTKTDETRIIPFELSNKFGTVISNEKEFEAYMNEYANDGSSTVMRYNNTYYCNGAIQEINFHANAVRPTASTKKYDSVCAIPSMMLAFIKATDIILKTENVKSTDDLDITWNIVALLPPGDLEAGKDVITEKAKSITRIDSAIPKMTFDVKIDKVAVLPEGLCAYMAVVFNTGRKVRTEYKYLTEETVLVADIGAGTTDFILVRNNKLVQNSKYTVNKGGNQVSAQVRSALNSKRKISISKDKLESALSEGVIKNGATKEDIRDIISDVRAEMGAELQSKVLDYFEEINIDSSEIGYIILCGGGSIDDKSGVKSLGYYVSKSLKDIIPNAEVVELPVRTVQKLDNTGEFSSVEEKMSPRELNILGACIMAETMI
jgi:hypothetical protein